MLFPAAEGPDTEMVDEKISRQAPHAPTWHSIKPDGVSSDVTNDPEISLSRADEVLPGKEDKSPGKQSSSDVSTTSTVEYDHTPFDKFRLQVEELCHIIWSPSANPSRVERLWSGSNNRIVGILRAKKGRPSQSSAPPKEFVIERVRGGGYNRVIGVTIISPTEDPVRLILRIPRWDWEARLDRDVAILRLVRHYTSIPVPEVKYMDLTTNNPLKSPYVIQDRIPGHDLQKIGHTFPNLSHEQQCTFAKAFGRILSSLHALNHPYPGLIEASAKDDGTYTFTVRPFEAKSFTESEEEAGAAHREKHFPFFAVRPFGVRPKLEEFRTTENAKYQQSTYYFLLAQFGRWKARDLQIDPATIGWDHQIARLVTAAGQMDRLGFLGDDQNCLCHLDLNMSPRNIMVDIDKDDALAISGILDWDSAVIAPKFVGCVPPMWIWAWSYDEEEDEREANNTPKTPEQQELKHLFEEAAGIEFVKYSYKPEYRLARMLFNLAMNGMNDGTSHYKVDQFLEEWDDIYESYLQREDKESQSEMSLEYVDTVEDPREGDFRPERAEHEA